MKVFVVGATGFLGTEICKELEKQNISYRAGSRSPRSEEHFVLCDILDKDSLRKALEGSTHLIHSAGFVSHESKDADRLWQTHVQGSQNLLEIAKELGIERVVYLSTSGTVAVSKEAEDIPSESSDSPFELIKEWPYYRSKYFAEQIALDFAKKGLDLVSLNPSLLLGPNDKTGASTKSIQLFLDDKIPVAPCGGIGFVDVRDVAQVVVSALSKGKSGERYLLNSSNMSFLEFYQRIARLAEKNPPMFKMPAITRKALGWFPKVKKIGLHLDKGDVELASFFWYADASKAERDLDFQPRDSMDTLFDTVDFMLEANDSFRWFDD